MSLKLLNASLTPNTVYTGGKFVISIEVYDDVFEFAETYPVYDKHQGFADIEQTVGGKLSEIK